VGETGPAADTRKGLSLSRPADRAGCVDRPSSQTGL